MSSLITRRDALTVTSAAGGAADTIDSIRIGGLRVASPPIPLVGDRHRPGESAAAERRRSARHILTLRAVNERPIQIQAPRSELRSERHSLREGRGGAALIQGRIDLLEQGRKGRGNALSKVS